MGTADRSDSLSSGAIRKWVKVVVLPITLPLAVCLGVVDAAVVIGERVWVMIRG